MKTPPYRGLRSLWPPRVGVFAMAAAVGCASPGPPRPPSLGLPQAVRGLRAERVGGTVQLHFTVPSRTTDEQPLRPRTLTGTLCRQVGAAGPCVPVDEAETQRPVVVPGPGPAPEVLWTDTLPPDLVAGAPRLLSYRVEFRSAAGRSGEMSEAAYAPAGDAPPPVQGFVAEGARPGVLLRWTPEVNAGEVLIERTAPDAPGPGRTGKHASESAGPVWLQAQPGNLSAGQTIDASAAEGVTYRYLALRRNTVTLGGRTLELRSQPSAPVELAWRDVYPPAVPTGLTAVGFDTPAAAGGKPEDAAAGYAIDLIWQPVDDARLAGYLVYRTALPGPGGQPGARRKLTPQPVTTPGFHDATAGPGTRYKYEVTTIDAKGNESRPAETTIEPT